MTEQQKFEAHMREEFGWEDQDFKSDSFGYYDSNTTAAWNAWQARASQDRSAELLGALVDVLGWVPGMAAWHTDAPMKAVERARAAISKARGE